MFNQYDDAFGNEIPIVEVFTFVDELKESKKDYKSAAASFQSSDLHLP